MSRRGESWWCKRRNHKTCQDYGAGACACYCHDGHDHTGSLFDAPRPHLDAKSR